MKRTATILLSVILVMALFCSTAFASQGNGSGKDKSKEWKTEKEHWGAKSIEKLQTYGLLNGYEDGTFKPDNTLTQAELAVIIDRLVQLKSDVDDDDDDSDIDEDELEGIPGWAKKAVMSGVKNNYLNLKRFHSEKQCDRLTAAVAIAKALDLEPVKDYTSNPFKDKGLIAEEDYGYLLALYEAGYIKGFPDGNFNPNAFLSRAQIASIIEKLLGEEDVDSDDDTAPSWASSSTVTATAISATSVTLKWSAATDDVAVTGYKVIYKLDGVTKEKLVSTTRTAKITGLEADVEYSFRVEAKDAAGNWSDDGPSVKVTTLEADEDTVAPTWPTSAALTVSPSSDTVVMLIWPDADDNVAVKGYKIYQDGTLIKTVDADENDAVVSNLKLDTEYTFKVKAYDEAGNVSVSLKKTYFND
ncbi:S-layer homology domain-containing protein [Sinanaerobacter chloroacetimidivorans]|uniref:S-layer homology domain-containing protein n=1 Tax=Sinanaerobacter chloroacetimidivorans TaxID=2818044 RepID=A0A8J7W0B2_9FIRM|nr:S-layer homology domain-containing protein [Sinanaerobacter chloroacetimidivorans]MBR0598009.1 S-layer homology domain-containing protein [Sinanaerobacter chloroacetimidivorans]